MDQSLSNPVFFSEIETLIEQSQAKMHQAVNFTMVQTYWQISKRIAEEEQAGNLRAGYGQYLIEMLSERISTDIGKGFSRRNVFYMRQFYESFPIVHALRAQLSWTHYYLILQVDDEIQHVKKRKYFNGKTCAL